MNNNNNYYYYNVVVFKKKYINQPDENEEDINYTIKISKIYEIRNKYQIELFDSYQRYFHKKIPFTNNQISSDFQMEDIVFEKNYNFETRKYDIWVTLHYINHGEYKLCILLEDQTLLIMNQQIKKLEFIKKIKYENFNNDHDLL
jgi:hypothetical protein